MQSAMMQILYKGIFRWFLKLIVGVQFPDTRFLRKEGQFIILANHNSHLDTLSLLSSEVIFRGYGFYFPQKVAG